MIKWLPSALRDTATIFGYVAEHDYAAPQRLIEFPRSGSERSDIADGLRAIKAGKYLLLYRINGKDIDIVRVLHSARDLAAAFAAELL